MNTMITILMLRYAVIKLIIFNIFINYNIVIKTITRLFNSIKDTEKRKSIGGRFLSYLILRPKMCSSLNQYYDRLIALIKSIPDSAKFADEDGK